MTRYLPIAAAIAVVIGSAVVNGSWTGRWKTSDRTSQAVARLELLPRTIAGTWESKPIGISDRALKVARIDGYIARRYEDHRTGAAVTVLAVCGQPGPIAVHTPDVCFTSTGYEKLSQNPVRFTFGDHSEQAADFTWGIFRRPDAPTEQQLNVYWAWSADGNWQSPANPRLHFAGEPFLYKVYVLADSSPNEDLGEQRAFKEFMNQFLVAANAALFSR